MLKKTKTPVYITIKIYKNTTIYKKKEKNAASI